MKTYTVKFGTGNPTLLTGLSPTLTLFARADTGATLAAPSFTEAVSGWGIYQFQWGTTTPIIFLADGATASLGSNRFISGQLDPVDRADEYGATAIAIGTSAISIDTAILIGMGLVQAQGSTSIALGTTAVALGVSLTAIGVTTQAIATSILVQGGSITVSVAGVGTSADPIGNTLTDPTTLFGYLKRALEIAEGQQSFTKGAGSWTMLDRTGATTLRTRTITNSASTVIRS